MSETEDVGARELVQQSVWNSLVTTCPPHCRTLTSCSLQVCLRGNTEEYNLPTGATTLEHKNEMHRTERQREWVAGCGSEFFIRLYCNFLGVPL